MKEVRRPINKEGKKRKTEKIRNSAENKEIKSAIIITRPLDRYGNACFSFFLLWGRLCVDPITAF